MPQARAAEKSPWAVFPITRPTGRTAQGSVRPPSSWLLSKSLGMTPLLSCTKAPSDNLPDAEEKRFYFVT